MRAWCTSSMFCAHHFHRFPLLLEVNLSAVRSLITAEEVIPHRPSVAGNHSSDAVHSPKLPRPIPSPAAPGRVDTGHHCLRYTLSNVKTMLGVCMIEAHKLATMWRDMLNLIRRRFRKECADHTYAAEIVNDLTV